jgi:putative aminopeptidase
MLRPLVLGAGVLLGGTLPVTVGAQDQDNLGFIALRLASVPAVTGYEQAIVDTILRQLPGGERDRAGNARVKLGDGMAKRLVVCPLDEPGYVVGRVREDGYLTLRRVGGPGSPLFDQQLEGHRVWIQGRRKLLPGVVAVRSIHLTRGRPASSEAPFTVDDAYVDVGAASPAEVAALGIGVLSPVTLAKGVHGYGARLLAAPVVGRRAACGALLLAALRGQKQANLPQAVIVAFVVEQELSQRGLGTLANEMGPFDETLIVDGRSGPRGELLRGPDPETSTRWPPLGRVIRWSLPVSYQGTAVETVWLKDMGNLVLALGAWMGGAQ